MPPWPRPQSVLRPETVLGEFQPRAGTRSMTGKLKAFAHTIMEAQGPERRAESQGGASGDARREQRRTSRAPAGSRWYGAVLLGQPRKVKKTAEQSQLLWNLLERVELSVAEFVGECKWSEYEIWSRDQFVPLWSRTCTTCSLCGSGSILCSTMKCPSTTGCGGCQTISSIFF